MFSNKIVTFVAIYPKQLFVDRCPTFLFSKLVRRLVEPSGYIDCEQCLALKNNFLVIKSLNRFSAIQISEFNIYIFYIRCKI